MQPYDPDTRGYPERMGGRENARTPNYAGDGLDAEWSSHNYQRRTDWVCFYLCCRRPNRRIECGPPCVSEIVKILSETVMLSLVRRFTPSLYTPNAPLGHRISNKEMPTTDIARVYHSTVTLTPKGYVTRLYMTSSKRFILTVC